jgi:hypothetical protein
MCARTSKTPAEAAPEQVIAIGFDLLVLTLRLRFRFLVFTHRPGAGVLEPSSL